MARAKVILSLVVLAGQIHEVEARTGEGVAAAFCAVDL
jgi:hypothetical protein